MTSHPPEQTGAAPIQNVNGRYRVRPDRIVRPRDLEELRAVVRGTNAADVHRRPDPPEDDGAEHHGQAQLGAVLPAAA